MPEDMPAMTEMGKPRLTLHPALATKVNFATAQNGVAVIKRLGIENCSAEPVESIRLTLTGLRC